MTKARKVSSDKIIIYQMPLVSRVIGVLSGVFFILLATYCLIAQLYESPQELVMMLLYLLLAISYSIFCVYFIAFKTYICLDMKSNTLIIREFPGYKQKVFSAYQLSSLTVSDGTPENNQHAYTLDLNFIGLTVKLNSWSVGYGAWLTAGINRKRLEKFCEKCNQYLNSRQK